MHRIPNVHIPMADKIAHLSFYGVLCGLSFRAFFLQNEFPRLSQCALCAALLFTIFYGVTDEVHQLFVWGRTSDILDITADALGGILFVIFFSLFHKRKFGTTAPAMPDTRV
jgi:VanZ family protein